MLAFISICYLLGLPCYAWKHLLGLSFCKGKKFADFPDPCIVSKFPEDRVIGAQDLKSDEEVGRCRFVGVWVTGMRGQIEQECSQHCDGQAWMCMEAFVLPERDMNWQGGGLVPGWRTGEETMECVAWDYSHEPGCSCTNNKIGASFQKYWLTPT